MRALVVEDHPRMSLLLERGLQEEGYAVDAAHNGVAALQCTDRRRLCCRLPAERLDTQTKAHWVAVEWRSRWGDRQLPELCRTEDRFTHEFGHGALADDLDGRAERHDSR